MDEKLLINILLSSLLSFFLAQYLIPLMKKAALELNILDIPDNNLKRHKEPTPYMGGMAVYMAIIFSVSILVPLNRFVTSFFLGATMIVLIGFVDDLKAMSPRLKFLLQSLAILIVIRGGIYIKLAIFPDYINYFLTFFWLLTIINAFNFLDVMNGLSTIVAISSMVFFIFYSSLQGNFVISLISTASLGAYLSFLYHNFPEAGIFLGDSGSMLLGYIAGVLSFAIDYSYLNRISVIIPIVLLFVPLAEITFTVVRRIYHGIPPWKGSPHHLSFFIRDKIGAVKTAYYFGFLVFLSGVSSVILSLGYFKLFFILFLIIIIFTFIVPLFYKRRRNGSN